LAIMETREGISTGSVQSDTEYDVFDSYADSHGPGSKAVPGAAPWYRMTDGICNPRQTPNHRPHRQAKKARRVRSAQHGAHAQKLQDAAEAQHVASPDSVMVAHKTTPASFTKDG